MNGRARDMPLKTLVPENATHWILCSEQHLSIGPMDDFKWWKSPYNWLIYYYYYYFLFFICHYFSFWIFEIRRLASLLRVCLSFRTYVCASVCLGSFFPPSCLFFHILFADYIRHGNSVDFTVCQLFFGLLVVCSVRFHSMCMHVDIV